MQGDEQMVCTVQAAAAAFNEAVERATAAGFKVHAVIEATDAYGLSLPTPVLEVSVERK